jgi:hypothetical protein
VLTEHEPGHLIVQATGFGFDRSDLRVLIHVVTKARPRELKDGFIGKSPSNWRNAAVLPERAS